MQGKIPDKEIRNIVTMEALSSTEHFAKEGREPQRVLRDIYLCVDRAQAWGITARSGYEIRLLLEIMGNIRPYDGGKCVLIERGMMRRKRVIQPHVFFIGETDMLYGNMNVLEYLMFATAGLREDRLSMQEELFEMLIRIGLGYMSLSAIRWLSAEEKAVVALIAAAYSGSRMVIMSLPESVFDERLSSAIAKAAEQITQRGNTLIIGTRDYSLVQKACSHTAFIADGHILYAGTVDHLRQEYDKVAVIITDPDIDGIRQELAPALHGCVLTEKDGSLLITPPDNYPPRHIYEKIVEVGTIPLSLRINEKTVGNAYEELMRQHDLSEQLF